MNLEQAHSIAESILVKISPYCDRYDIAGSVRRLKPEVGDIEIVCQPKIEVLKDMFGWDEGTIKNLQFQEIVDKLGKVIKGNTDGRYMQIELPEGINLDLFMPEPSDYYRQLAIRTGSADYSFKVIATGWKLKGWVGTESGLRKMAECIEKKLPDGKSKWSCHIATQTLPPKWTNEKQFFDWIGVQWIEPRLRNV